MADNKKRIQDLEGRLTTAPSMDLSPEGLEDLETLVDFYLQADSYVPALETLESILRLEALRDPTDPRRISIECKSVECLCQQGRYRDAALRAERVIRHTTEETPPELRARIHLNATDALTQLSQYEEAKEQARKAQEIVRQIGDKQLLATALSRAGVLWMRLGNWILARDLQEESKTLYQSLGEEGRVADAEANLGIIHKNLCEWAVASHYLQSALARDRALGNYAKVANRLQNLGIIQLKSGEWEKAHDSFVEARRIYREVGNTRGLIANTLSLGIHSRLVGRFDESEKLLQGALADALGSGLMREETLAREFLGDLALSRGEPVQALELYQAALVLGERAAPAGDIVSEVLRRVAEVQLILGKVEDAEKSIERCRQICDLLDDRYEGAVLHRISGSLAIRQGEYEDAVREWRTAVNLLGEMGERYERGRALFLLAQHSTDPVAARKFAYRASACFAEVGAEGRLSEVESWLADRVAPTTSATSSETRRPRLTSRLRAESVGLVGVSRGLSRALDMLERAAETDLSVLITGPSGTGKELVARAIHERSGRSDRPFLPVNCGALRADLAISQLFGHRKGAYTGANSEGQGLVEAAHNGTLFLDEIGELPLDVQVTLLRFLERGDYLRLGETTLRHADVRIIAATHVDLREAVSTKDFRADLFYRLNEIEIALPPLADRMDDVLPIAHHFLRLYNPDREIAITPEAAAVLTSYDWPGNVRELENCIKRALALRRHDGNLEADDLDEHLGRLETKRLAPSRAPGERAEILDAIERAGGNKSNAAALLGVSRKTLYARMRKLGIPLEPAPVAGKENA